MRLPDIIRKLLERWRPGIDIALAVSVIVSTGWLTDFLRGEPFALFEDLPPVSSWLASVGVALALTTISATWLYKRRLNFTPVRHLTSQDKVKPRKVLIACLSDNNSTITKEGDLLRIKVKDKEVLLSSDLKQAKDSKELSDARWSWQQLLRAIYPHESARTLEHIYILCSEQSLKQADACKLLLRHLLRDAVQLHVKDPVDFESLQKLYNSFNHMIQEITDKGYAQSDIMIDATAGQKPTSIAAALVTLHRPSIEFQYVSTRGSCAVLSYNVVATSPVELGS